MGKKRYLPLYKKWMRSGSITDTPDDDGAGGLCSTEIGRDKLLGLFKPCTILHDSSFWGITHIGSFWGYGEPYSCDSNDVRYEFTPLRQNIVLFLAAMNNEF